MNNRFKNSWDERYIVEEYVYGKEPNEFFKYHLDRLTPGKILLPGEGEGRNAVFAAISGWSVTAFDISIEGYKKAVALAREKRVSIDYEIKSYLEFIYEENLFDAAGLFFTHQPSEMRKYFHLKLVKSLKPGGILLLEGFHKNQLHRDSGGPKNPDFLYGEKELQSDFHSLEILELNVLKRDLNEGLFHQGKAEVIQMVAKKSAQ